MGGLGGEGGVDSGGNNGAAEPDLGDAGPEAYPAAGEQAESIFLADAGGAELSSPLLAAAVEIHGNEWGSG
jgi:hypothetical protein